MKSRPSARYRTIGSLLTGPVWLRLLIGWGAVLAVTIVSVDSAALTGPVLACALLLLVAVIAYCAFGVVEQAEHLARRLGDPYGSLILTLSIVIIEVILIVAVMLGPGESSTIARDSVMAVSMVIMNLIVGLSLLLGALRHGSLRLNATGSSSYLAMLILLITVGLIMPAAIGESGSYSGGQQVMVVIITLGVYAFFLLRQTTAEAQDYQEESAALDQQGQPAAAASVGIREVISQHRLEIISRSMVLVVTVLPIVLLSHDMASLLDDGLQRLEAPIALAGLLIAMIVFLPEGITALRAGLNGEVQRVINLGHGALVSTVGLTIPAVLIIGAVTGQTVVLAESLPHIILLAVSILLAMNTVLAKRISAGHGAVHLAAFLIYCMTLFN